MTILSRIVLIFCIVGLVVACFGAFSANALLEDTFEQPSTTLTLVFDEPEVFNPGMPFPEPSEPGTQPTIPGGVIPGEVTPSAVPEPGTVWLLGLGVAVGLYFTRKIRKSRR